MVMAAPRRHHDAQAVAQEAQAHQETERPATATAGLRLRGRVGRQRSAVLRIRGDGGDGGDRGDGGDVVCPCGQWSIGRPGLGTLVRHVLRSLGMALALAPGPRGMGQAAAEGALIAASGLAPGVLSGLARARPAAIAVTSVAAPARHRRLAAAREQELPARSVHAHSGATEGVGRTRPSGPNCDCTAYIGTV